MGAVVEVDRHNWRIGSDRGPRWARSKVVCWPSAESVMRWLGPWADHQTRPEAGRSLLRYQAIDAWGLLADWEPEVGG